VNQGKNAGHQAWLRRWLGDPITVRVTYREHWWDGDDSEDPNEDSGYVQYMICPSPCVRGWRVSTDHLWGDDFSAWWAENGPALTYEFSITDAAQLCADWPGELYNARDREMVEEAEYEEDYRTGHWSMETLHVDGPADKVEAVFVLMDEIRAHRWSPMDIEV
jgi:hypothetical protein